MLHRMAFHWGVALRGKRRNVFQENTLRLNLLKGPISTALAF